MRKKRNGRSGKLPGLRRMVLMMKLSVFFLCASFLTATANGYSQHTRLSLMKQNASMIEVLSEISRKTEMQFLYNDNELQGIQVNVSLKNATLSEMLDKIFDELPLTYSILDNVIVVSPKEKTELPQAVKTMVISGEIKDKDGNPLPGATVRIKETSIGVVSDQDGRFKLEVSDMKGLVLQVSFIGYKTQFIKPGVQKTLHIVLEEEAQKMDEVVVTGYSKLKKESFTGNATVVNKDQLIKANNKNVIAALQVFDPSFRIKENNIWGSDPNHLPEFTIRGEGSIAMQKGLDVEKARRDSRAGMKDNPNLPIFILDGFEVSVQKIYDMDINRIASMTILKDAAATAMYGSRAANGVVVVTSVAPKPGEIRVNYNFTAGTEFPDLSDYNLCTAEEKLYVEKLSGKYDSNDPSVQNKKMIEYNELLNEVRRGVETDWLALPLRNVFNHTHSLNVSGGVESIRYSFDMNYNTGNGAMKGSYRDRAGVGLTIDFRHKGWLQLQNSVMYNMTRSQDSPYGYFDQYSKLQPYYAIYDEKGELLERLHGGETNPLWKAEFLGSYSGRSTLYDLTDNFSANLFLFEGFSIKGQFSITKTNNETESFEDPKDPIFKNRIGKERGRLSRNQDDGYVWNLNAMAYYNRGINKHFINATMGVNMQNKKSVAGATTWQGFQLGNLNGPSYAAKQPDKTTSNTTESRLIGFLGSVNYSYDNIYLLDASFRLDGSSQFGSQSRFAPFWSFGAGINIHNYEWFKSNPIFSTLRLRGTYGSTGKVNFPAYTAITTYKTSSDSWYYNTPANSLIYLGNPDLTWEKTNTLDLGINLGLWQDKITVEANYYRKETTDLIDEVAIRTSSGFEKFYSNSGSIMNKGFEVKLNATVYQDNDWTVALNATLGSNKNEITKLGSQMEAYNKQLQENYEKDAAAAGEYSELQYIPLTHYYVGASTSAIYAVPSYGIDPATGKELFRKRNGESTYTWTASDMVVVGDESPDAQGSFSINVGWKGVYVNANFMYEWGAQQYNETLLNKVEYADIWNSNVDRRVLSQRWVQSGDVAPFYDIRNKVRSKPTSRFVQNNNYLSFSSLAIGYDFKPSMIKKLRLNTLGIRFNANELGRWSTIKAERGLGYPYAKNFSFTLNVGF